MTTHEITVNVQPHMPNAGRKSSPEVGKDGNRKKWAERRGRKWIKVEKEEKILKKVGKNEVEKWKRYEKMEKYGKHEEEGRE